MTSTTELVEYIIQFFNTQRLFICKKNAIFLDNFLSLPLSLNHYT